MEIFAELNSALLWWQLLEGNAVPNTRLFWIAILGTTISNLIIQYVNTKARMLADISLTTPVQAMTPGLVTVAVLTLGEFPSTQGIIGIFLISIGTYIHFADWDMGLKGYIKPFQFLFLPKNFANLTSEEKEIRLKERKALRYAYVGAIIGTIGLISDSLVAKSGSVPLGFSMQAILLTLGFSVLIQNQHNNLNISNKTSVIKKIFLLTMLGIFYGLHVIFIMTSFRIAPVAYIGSLKRLSILLTVVLATFILKEKNAKQRLIPAGIITFGAALLAFDSSIEKLIDKIIEI